MKLLSIDGGGIKGLYSAVVLEYIEKKYGLRIIDHVDIISGTSIGGIVALALAAGKRPKEIIEFLVKKGPIIFPNEGINKYFNFLKSLFFSKYNNIELKKACIEFFTEKVTLKDLYELDHPKRKRNQKLGVCIPSVNLSTGKNKVFKTPHSVELINDKKYKLWEVALATSAAPYYLPIFRLEKEFRKETYIDGGLWSNNPSEVALTEALTYYNKESNRNSIDKIELLSIGNVNESNEKVPKLLNRGFIPWNLKLISLLFDCQSQSTHNIIDLLFRQNKWNYIRIEHLNTKIKGISLDSTNSKSLNSIQELAMSDISQFTSSGSEIDRKLKRFFELEE